MYGAELFHQLTDTTHAGVVAQNSSVTANLVRDNFGVGIVANNSVLVDNLVSLNKGVGIDANSRAGYGNNVLNDNNSGGAQVSGGPLQIGTNVCQGDTICP